MCVWRKISIGISYCYPLLHHIPEDLIESFKVVVSGQNVLTEGDQLGYHVVGGREVREVQLDPIAQHSDDPGEEFGVSEKKLGVREKQVGVTRTVDQGSCYDSSSQKT